MTCKDLKEFLDNLSGYDISDFNRHTEYVMFRNWYFYFSYKYAQDCFSLRYVGETINRNHATVIHGYNRFLDYLQYNKELANKTNELENKILDKFKLEKKESFTSHGNEKRIINFRNDNYKNVLKQQYDTKIEFLEKKIKRQDTILKINEDVIKNLRLKVRNLGNKLKKQRV